MEFLGAFRPNATHNKREPYIAFFFGCRNIAIQGGRGGNHTQKYTTQPAEPCNYGNGSVALRGGWIDFSRLLSFLSFVRGTAAEETSLAGVSHAIKKQGKVGGGAIPSSYMGKEGRQGIFL